MEQMAFLQAPRFSILQRPGHPPETARTPAAAGRQGAGREMIRLGEKLSSQYHAGFRGRTVSASGRAGGKRLGRFHQPVHAGAGPRHRGGRAASALCR